MFLGFPTPASPITPRSGNTSEPSDLDYDRSSRGTTRESKFGASSIRSDSYSARDDASLSEDSTSETSTKDSETSASATIENEESNYSYATTTASYSTIQYRTESVFRKRSPPVEKSETRSKEWRVKSPRKMTPLTPRFQRFVGEDIRAVSTIEEGPSEDEASVLATIEQDRDSDNRGESAPDFDQNHPLHQVCLSASDPEELWRNVSLATRSSMRKTDCQGRNPLHCLSYNAVMIDNVALGPHRNAESTDHIQISRSLSMDNGRISTYAKERLRDFVTQVLVRIGPKATTSEDMCGYIPFEGALTEWARQMTLIAKDGLESDSGLASERFAWVKSIKRVGRQLNSARSVDRSTSKNSISTSGDIESAMPTFSECCDLQPTYAPQIRLTSASYLAFQMLSDIIDYLDQRREVAEAEKRRSKNDASAFSMDFLDEPTHISYEIIRKIASIPRLVYAVLLLDDEEQRRFVFSTSMMQSVLASRYSVGGWLTEMLQSREKGIADSGIEYLKIVSETAYDQSEDNDGSKSYQTNGQGLVKVFDPREEVAEAISNLEGFVPSLLSLRERHVEEAATTQVVQRILDKIMSRRFCITIVFCDALFLATQITGFRLAVNSLVVGGKPGDVLMYVYITNIGLFYFLIRELGKAASLFSITKKARVYISSFWNVTDLLSTILTIASVIAIRRGFNRNEVETDISGIRNLLAAATGFMWLRCLSFLKGINMQLATFILAILQIAKDVFVFCIIVLILVIAFSQMFFTILAPDSCSISNNSTGSDQLANSCMQSEYFLTTYLLLIFQELDRDLFTTSFSVFLVVIYSFMVVLVMLNVLIAVASDSYERCLVRSTSLFGRARVMMIAELVCFQHLLRRNTIDEQQMSAQLYRAWWSANWRVSGWSRASVLFFGLAFLVLISWVVGELTVVLAGPSYGILPMSIGSIGATVVIFVGILFFLSSEARRRHAQHQDVVYSTSFREGWFQKAMLHVLGSSGECTTAALTEWRGRMLYLKEEMIRLSEETQLHMDEKAKTIESSWQEDMTDIRRSVTDLREEMKANHQMLQNTLMQVFHTLNHLNET
ncbi:hypothetical protein ACA910_002840 [Epithemia clementina (nom. ined.)]